MASIIPTPDPGNPGDPSEFSGLVSLNGGVPVTTTLAIAEGTENDHASVIKLVRTYQADLEEFGLLGFEIQENRGTQGAPTQYAILNEQQATLVLALMRNSEIVVRFKVSLVKAFWELARIARQTTLNPANLTRLQLISMAMEAEQERLALADKVNVLTPKAEALDRIATATEGSYCLTNAAKILQMKPRGLMAWLQANDWIYRRIGGQWTGYQAKIKAGYLEHKIIEFKHSDGTPGTGDQVRITAKGMAKLAEVFHVAIAS